MVEIALSGCLLESKNTKRRFTYELCSQCLLHHAIQSAIMIVFLATLPFHFFLWMYMTLKICFEANCHWHFLWRLRHDHRINLSNRKETAQKSEWPRFLSSFRIWMGAWQLRFCLPLLAAILSQKAYLRKSVVLPSTLTLQLDELGDEYEDSAELMASISIESKVKDKPI